MICDTSADTLNVSWEEAWFVASQEQMCFRRRVGVWKGPPTRFWLETSVGLGCD